MTSFQGWPEPCIYTVCIWYFWQGNHQIYGVKCKHRSGQPYKCVQLGGNLAQNASTLGEKQWSLERRSGPSQGLQTVHIGTIIERTQADFIS